MICDLYKLAYFMVAPAWTGLYQRLLYYAGGRGLNEGIIMILLRWARATRNFYN